MEFLVKETDGDTLFRLITGIVVPRPIGWISTVSREGVYNLAPFSFFNAVNDCPPVVMVSVSDRDDGSPKDTARNILDTGEFVVNIVSEDLLEKMVITSEEFPPEVDEFKKAGLTPESSKTVKAPRVKEARAKIECRLLKHIRVYDTNLFLGEAQLIYVADHVADGEGRVDPEKLRAVGRIGGGMYVKAFGDSILRA
ncbi:MAG: flavin reductase family protein [Aquificota bacterium]|nr:flavin reductase family protein [Aquificota bacterium]